MAVLTPYDRLAFKKPKSGAPSRGWLGLCSYCTRSTTATHMIVTHSQSKWAVCRLHARLFFLREAIKETRSVFDQPALEAGLYRHDLEVTLP